MNECGRQLKSTTGYGNKMLVILHLLTGNLYLNTESKQMELRMTHIEEGIRVTQARVSNLYKIREINTLKQDEVSKGLRYYRGELEKLSIPCVHNENEETMVFNCEV